MKKTLIASLGLAMLATTSMAQTFNRTYQHLGRWSWGLSVTVANSYDGTPEDVFFTTADSPNPFVSPGSPVNRSKIVKVDANTGNFIDEIERDTSNMAERLFTTADNNILLLSLYLEKMVVTKYDRNLNQIWAREIPHTGALVHRWFSYMDMEPAIYTNPDFPDEPGIENFYITYAVGSDLNDYRNDEATKVIRMDQNGNLIWAKTYDIPNRDYLTSDDYACAITSFYDEESQQKLFAIAGGRNSGISSPHLYSFLIDENGAMASQFKEIRMDGVDFMVPDIIYDPNTDSLVITYTHEGGSMLPASDVASGVGVLKLDKHLTGGRGRVFWHECENYANAITILSTGEYVIDGWTGRCYTYQSQFKQTPIFLRLDANLDKQSYFRYNPHEEWQNNGFHVTDNKDHSYMLANGTNYTPTFPPVWLSVDTRLIKDNAGGEACGARDFDIEQSDFEISIEQVGYDVIDWQPYYPISISQSRVSPNIIDCADAGKPTNIGNTNAIKLASVYPTLVQNKSTETITCDLTNLPTEQLQVVVYNALGQEVYKNANLTGNKVSIQASVLSQGINFVRIKAGNQTIVTEKVTVID